MINQLTLEQEDLIPVYLEKWRSQLLSTQPIKREKATRAVKRIYQILGKKEPTVNFYASQQRLIFTLLEQNPVEVAQRLGSPWLRMPLSYELLAQINKQIEAKLWEEIRAKLELTSEIGLQLQLINISVNHLSNNLSESQMRLVAQLWQELSQLQLKSFWQQEQAFLRQQILQLPGGDMLVQLGDSMWEWGESVLQQISQDSLVQNIEQLLKELSLPWLELAEGLELFFSWYNTSLEASSVAVIDYCVSVLGCSVDVPKWEALRDLVADCHTMLMFENSCLMSDRPLKLCLDEQNRLHAEGEAAVTYGDGLKFYAYAGVNLPERYGRVHPHQWQSQWLLREPNAELRRVLIQGIGYGRICQELQAKELDSWREYTLLEITDEIDFESVHLLKMTCPSTQHIHVLRVPPDILSAREAIRWANWGIDPEDFSVST